MKAHLTRLFQGQNLSRQEARSAMESIMDGKASPEELAGFLGAIAARGETRHELVGCVEAMRSRALSFPVQRRVRWAFIVCLPKPVGENSQASYDRARSYRTRGGIELPRQETFYGEVP